ncbi:MFS transporter [Gordonia pseudamarae]|uniref:MFS transporter n=1 Tax=Gordonia pseudamarae TaxID=2831662 RepID=A0ABX6IGC4_9ACTN|nr:MULTISPECIES: MFS transporter [Gordonia]MBD0024142.1 MFS transporter [Gordonia sp. (in: high G+C Gram-positive bacteria)]QHN25938.1 MFS transporter [Gordonia pseudamarae]QHN34869.1 MFS transporter [Gordonia pseudamarae]
MSAAPPELPSTAARARLCVTAIFALNGFLAALWVAHIPVIGDRAQVSHAQLGGLLLLIGACAFVAMQLCGPVIDRWGSRPTTVTGALLLCVAVIGPALARDPETLAVSLALFGFANGALDVSMNSQAVAVERAYRRPIMSAFHGYFSVGSLIGSVLVALTLWLDAGVVPTVIGGAVFGAAVVAAVRPGLVPRGYGDPRIEMSTAGTVAAVGDRRPPSPRWWREVDRRQLVVLAAVAFAVMLAEGTAYDWSSLHIVETFGTADAVGAIAFGAFSAAMTVARLGVDRIAATFGPVRLVRYGALIAAVGMLIAVLAPSAPPAIGGWTVFGIGLAGLIPQIFTAAGNLTVHAGGRVISVVVGCGYLGMLAGPALIGFLSGAIGLSGALVVAIVALVLAASAAGVVAPGARIAPTS